MHQDAFDLVSEGVLWLDGTGKVQYGNDSAARLLGYTRNALLRVSYFEIDPHFSMLRWKRFWRRLQDNQTSERLETEFVNREGKIFGVRGRVGFDIYSVDPELCIIVFRASESDNREADLLEAMQRDGRIGAWEYNLTNNQIYLSTIVRRWLNLPEERGFYGADEFLTVLKDRLPESIYSQVRPLYKDIKSSARTAEAAITLDRDYILRAESRENEFEVYKIYGTLQPAEVTQASVMATGEQRQTSDVFRTALDRQSDAVYLVSYANRSITYANDRATQFTGYAKRELLGMRAARLARPEDADQMSRLYELVRERGYMEFGSITRLKGGKETTVLAKVYYYREEDEEYLLIITRDERERAAAEENIQLYQKTIDTLNEWVIWLNASHRIVLLNEAAQRKLRRKTSLDLEGQRLTELMPDLSIPSIEEMRQRQVDGRSRPSTTYIYTTNSGEDRTLQIRFTQVAADSRSYLCLICRDVTLQQTNRRKLQQTKLRVDELTKQLKSENEALREQVEQINTGGSIITVSKTYQQVLAQIAQVADTDATVLVTGETGTGKELLAQSIHTFSRRNRQPLVSVNCAALPENLIESELFGHERGAFTGAVGQKKGKFELADNGTIFLDEIGELPLEMQAKLLRVLQEGEIQRIGSTQPIHVDVRIVAATNRDLERMITEGKFREDLFYRLNVFPIHNIPLRERPEDIPVLVKHFTKVYADRMGRNITHINPRDLDRLSNYNFPGNVRELINLVERAVITTRGDTLNLDASLQALRRPERNGEARLSLKGDHFVPFEDMQRQYIIEALRRTNGKVTGPGGAAELLDLNGRTLMSKMNKMGIDRNKYTG